MYVNDFFFNNFFENLLIILIEKWKYWYVFIIVNSLDWILLFIVMIDVLLMVVFVDFIIMNFLGVCFVFILNKFE